MGGVAAFWLVVAAPRTAGRSSRGGARWTTPAVELDPQIIETLKAWTAKLRGDR
jgi:hypothetical protein